MERIVGRSILGWYSTIRPWHRQFFGNNILSALFHSTAEQTTAKRTHLNVEQYAFLSIYLFIMEFINIVHLRLFFSVRLNIIADQMLMPGGWLRLVCWPETSNIAQLVERGHVNSKFLRSTPGPDIFSPQSKLFNL